MSRSRIVLWSLAVAILAGASFAGSALAARRSSAAAALVASSSPSTGNQPVIAVDGCGRVLGAPDVLSLDMGVEVRRTGVQEALDIANREAAKVVSALRKNGVAAKDVQTTSLSIDPDYSYPNGGPPRIRGYVVSNRVRAKIRDLAHAGRTIQAAATAGGNDARIDGVAFDLEDNAALLASAREAAFNDARAKAEQYARLAGRGLGRVVSVSETVSNTPPPPIAYDKAIAAPLASVPISPGQQEVAVLVTVIYELQ